MPIERFLCAHIAIFRPRNKTFHLLQREESRGRWLPYPMYIHPNDYRLRRSFHKEELATLPLRRKKPLEVLCTGYYIETFDESLPKYIPVCIKTRHESIPPSVYAHPIPYPTKQFIEPNPLTLWISSFDP
jgi:hypothetical protein